MEPHPHHPKRQVLDVLVAARAEEHEVQVRQLRLALEWALLHPAAEGAAYAGWGDDGLVLGNDVGGPIPLAGDGAPLVAAAAPLELAGALNRPAEHAQQLLGDTLELAFRLPRLWELMCAGRIAVWRARAISRETRDLSLDAALHADRLLCAVPDRLEQLSAAGAARLVHEARLHADPDRARADEDEAQARRGVWLQRDGRAPAVTDVHLTLDTPDALAFDTTVGRLAADLKELGDTDVLDVRRAKAVGVLADPQHALDLMSGETTDSGPRGAGTLDLNVHLTPSDLADDQGVVVLERLGALSADLFAGWLARHAVDGVAVRVRPVIDLSADASVDRHDPPPAMREQVILRDATCVFPGCQRDSRSCDLDHIRPYDPAGPPDQTRPSNLAPLCRRHHRAKTHAGWTYVRRRDGTYDWTSPQAKTYSVVPTSRAPLATHR
ncbi:HNH endonuclease signature motif containing protein [Nocardioides aequoreus]|uniref:HNH endonuclease signature motif containing protein n=1 Tax=Nocardioides aequoreus TaxID=397278 RepID=UPI0004C4595B|nr:HNH endonuclease signature motif containing protein [Nocardioides aequoreus]